MKIRYYKFKNKLLEDFSKPCIIKFSFIKVKIQKKISVLFKVRYIMIITSKQFIYALVSTNTMSHGLMNVLLICLFLTLSCT